jgi:putative nucleotidyltransferase with HDIG domain
VPLADTITRSEVLSALTYALDLAEGQPAGHIARTGLIALRTVEALGGDAETRRVTFEAALLKDVGCSASSARVAAALGTDERWAKSELKLHDWTRLPGRVRYAARVALPGAPPARRAGRLLALAAQPSLQREFVAARCERGAEIACGLGFDDDVAEAIRGLDEHWDGQGQPRGLRGRDIPFVSRVLCAAQTFEVFAATHGPVAAWEVLAERRGRWFDPEVVGALQATAGDTAFWSALPDPEPERRLAELAPRPDAVLADDDWLDRVADGFARVIDAKSPFTAHHSRRVTQIADGIAARLGLPVAHRRELHRAALLHDIGKLAISNRVLDKPGPLDSCERRLIREHPRHTARILQRVDRFAAMADVAAAHHERLDGSGYPDGLVAEQLGAEARALAVADVFEALTSDRPYRRALTVQDALGILRREAGTAFCAMSVQALAESLQEMDPATGSSPGR